MTDYLNITYNNTFDDYYDDCQLTIKRLELMVNRSLDSAVETENKTINNNGSIIDLNKEFLDLAYQFHKVKQQYANNYVNYCLEHNKFLENMYKSLNENGSIQSIYSDKKLNDDKLKKEFDILVHKFNMLKDFY